MSEITVAFPSGSVICAPGDYLVCRNSGSRWKVYQVEDLLLIKRLIPVLNDPASLFIEEHMLDSMSPAYHNEVQLLLTAYEPDFADESEAAQAINLQTLAEQVRHLLRPAKEFPESECRVIHPSGA